MNTRGWAIKGLTATYWVLASMCLPSMAAANNNPFPLPASLKADVNFWTKVYSEVTTNEGFIHDKQHLNVIYTRLSFKPGTSRKTRQASIDSKKAYYHKILLELASHQHIRLRSYEHKRLKALWPKGTTAKTFREAAKNLRFQLGQADRFKAGVIRSGRWQHFIKREFKAMGIPVGLASLPHVESSFRPDAKSHAGAAGLWQFTRSTGRRFMRIDHVVDERLDPYLATHAAGLLLKDNFKKTGSWPLALTAYNHGARGVQRAIEATGGLDIAKIVREYKGRTFGFASRNFYNAFVAAHDIDQNTADYFGDIKREPPVFLNEVTLPTYYTAQGIIQAFSLNNNIFKSLNPALQSPVWAKNKYVPKGYSLRLPLNKPPKSVTRLMANIPGSEQSTKQMPDVEYRVKPGDSLSKIAQKFNVSSRELAVMNGLRSRHKIYIGQVLRLPSKVKKSLTFYRVKKGDVLSSIARQLGIPQLEIARLNRLRDNNKLYAGQKLRLK